MSPREAEFAHRRSFRASLPEKQKEAILKVGPLRFAARLVDESVEGTAVRVDGDPGVKPDDVVRLTTSSGTFNARVVRMAQLEPQQSHGNRDGPQFCLGLEWLQRPAMPPDVPATLPQSTLPPAPCLPGEG